MRIGIDCRSILNPRGGEYAGVGHYTYYLVRALLALDSEHTFVLFFNDGVDTAPFHRSNTECVVFPGSRYKRFLPFVYNHVIVPQLLLLHRLDLYHNPANVIPLGYFGPSIVTIHDLAIYKNPSWFPGRQWFSTKITVPASIKRARRIIAVSDSTSHDIQELFHVPVQKIQTVFHGVENYADYPIQLEKVRAAIRELPQPYFLYIGTIEPRKNLRRLIEGFARFIKEHPTAPHHLVIAGKRGWKYRSVFDAVRRCNIKDRIHFTGYILLDEKVYLLRNGFCFVFPSLYEGFGLPVLEAMSVGLPLITSNVGSIPEIVIDKAFLIDPLSVESISKALSASLGSEKNLLHSLRETGTSIARHYTWEQCARNTLDAYLRAVRAD